MYFDIMTIFYLRHEDRPLEDSTFHIELSKLGKHRSKTSLKKLLLELNISEIYCSPFIRCLQTIHPFVRESGTKLNVDYALQEIFFDKNFIRKPSSKLNLRESIHFQVNSNYNSSLEPNTLKYEESMVSVNSRVSNFVNNVLSPHIESKKNILVCTHMGIVNILISNMSKMKRDPNDFYDMGIVSKIENGDIIFLN